MLVSKIRLIPCHFLKNYKINECQISGKEVRLTPCNFVGQYINWNDLVLSKKVKLTPCKFAKEKFENIKFWVKSKASLQIFQQITNFVTV